MLFELTEEERLIQAAAARFAKLELEPVAAELDRTKNRDILLANLKKLSELGFMGVSIGVEYGGTDSNSVALSLVLTELGRACAATTVTISVTNMVAELIQSAGTEAQKRTYLPRLCGGGYAVGEYASPRLMPARMPRLLGRLRNSPGSSLDSQRTENICHQRRLCRALYDLGGG